MSCASRLCLIAPVLLLLLSTVPPAGAEIVDHGPQGEYFHDTVTGLYWFDPALFHEQARVTLDLLADHSMVWGWALQSEVEALMGQTAVAGASLEDAMGLRRSSIANGGPRWLGYYFGSANDGWLVQSDDLPDFATITATSHQAGAASYGAGAWFVSAVDPVIATSVLEDHGDYFRDLSTDLYWCDPSLFFGLSREEVATWLTTHTDWGWATRDEVFGLLGLRTAAGIPLEDVLGTRSSTIVNGGPRWLGYFAEDGVINGLLLQSGIADGFEILDTGSTQANAASFNPGAWLVSEVDPTPNEVESWGDVKRDYR